MRFGPTAEQRSFAAALDRLLAAADVPAVARSWAGGDPAAGLALWRRLAGQGVSALAVPPAAGGLGAGATDLVAAFGRLGYHGVPGPWVETAAVAPRLLAAAGDPDGLLPGVAGGAVVVGLAAPPHVPHALDLAVTTHGYLLDGATLHRAVAGPELESVDPTRRLVAVRAGARVAALDPAVAAAALDAGTMACAAQLVGLGERMLHDTVGYARARQQFGRPVGGYQAVQHLLADVRVALDFAVPLVHGAALSLDAAAADAPRDVSAAKVAAGEAALLAGRTALQVHGAIGYTRECDLSLWFTKARALAGAWGTAAWHRGRVLDALVGT